jgi:hypothetical protein
MRMRKTLTLVVLLPALAMSLAGKKGKKDKGNKEPAEGWVVMDAEKNASCYKTPDFASMPSGPARLARAKAIGEIIGQWNGQRDDGVKFSDKTATNVETVLLGDPEDMDELGPENFEWCKKVMKGQATASDWEMWASDLKARFTKGECRGSLLPQTMYDYLDIGAGWQIPAPFCKDDEIVIEVSAKDYYRISKDGPWINGAGDTSQPAKSGLPCTLEGCYKGTVILKFKTDEGMEIIEPVGTGRVWRAPAHGVLTVMINEDDFNENEWKVEGGMQHHASVGYSPK